MNKILKEKHKCWSFDANGECMYPYCIDRIAREKTKGQKVSKLRMWLLKKSIKWQLKLRELTPPETSPLREKK